MPKAKSISQKPSTGQPKSGEVACSVRLKRPGEPAKTVGARGRGSRNKVLMACSRAWKAVKDKLK